MSATSAVARVAGDDFWRLPAEVQAVHSGATIRMVGRAHVQRGVGLIPRTICALLGFPRNGSDQPVAIRFSTDSNGADRWERDFDGLRYASSLSPGSGSRAGCLVERLGPFMIVFRLSVTDGRLTFRLVGLSLFHTPLPGWLLPSCTAFEGSRDGRFTFDILVELPLLGRLIHYAGELRMDE